MNHPLFPKAHKATDFPQKSILSFIKIKRLAGSAKNKVVLVFDGYSREIGTDYPEENYNVIFSRTISADEKIKKIVEKIGNRKSTIVVSDDKEVKFIARSQGARHMSVEEFIKPKGKIKGQARESLAPPELSYTQMRKINEELSRVWLK
jgi:predicted RNA-binding protein with PIN domain